MARSFYAAGMHHGPDAEVSVNTGGEVPILNLELPGGARVDISPSTGWPREGFTEDHLRFADELVTAAQEYRDVIAGARLWDGLDHGPGDVEGVA
jgi:hypothetical protein